MRIGQLYVYLFIIIIIIIFIIIIIISVFSPSFSAYKVKIKKAAIQVIQVLPFCIAICIAINGFFVVFFFGKRFVTSFQF